MLDVYFPNQTDANEVSRSGTVNSGTVLTLEYEYI